MNLAYVLALIFLSSFILTYFVTPIMIRRLSRRGLTGKDMNKMAKPEVAEMGGMSVMLGISLGIVVAAFVSTFVGDFGLDLKILFASFLTIFFVGFIGVIDDLIGWRKGIRQYQHALFPLFAALPLMAINAGTESIVVPFVGSVSFGIFYALVLIPIGITGASNAFNMLAGFNGLEAGLGILIISTLTLIGFLTGKTEAVILGVAMLGALIAFLRFNWFPAKVFGGDSLTLMIGASIATISIIGNMEKVGIIIIALHWLELLYKAKHRFQSESFGIPQKDGTLKPDPKGGSLTHAFMRLGKFTEPKLVMAIFSAQALICIVVFSMFYFKLF